MESGVYETNPIQNYRQFDLNAWLNGYVKQQQAIDDAGDVFNQWYDKVVNSDLATLSSKEILSPTNEGLQLPALGGQALLFMFMIQQYKELVEGKFKNYNQILNRSSGTPATNPQKLITRLCFIESKRQR